MDDLSRMAGDPRYISGIYNYCDSWCERCAFTERCLNYATRLEFEEMAREAREEREEEELFEELIETMEIDLDQPDVEAEEDIYDLDDVEMDEIMAEEERIRQRGQKHPLTRAANSYMNMANDWFAFEQGKERPAGNEVLPTEPEMVAQEIESRSPEVVDAVEIIRWYQIFIYVKIQRALHSMEREAQDLEFWSDMPKDSEGTAKIALIAIDRSSGAWGTLIEAYPERRTMTLPILALLTRLRHDLELEFPNAWVFIRPGFDEVEPADQDGEA